MNNVRKETKILTVSAILVAIGLALKYVVIRVPISGVNGMEIWFGGPFVNYIAILFGPVWGLISGAAADFIGFFVKGGGNYIPWLTLTAALKGLCIGLIWRYIRKINISKLSVAYYIVFAVMLLFGLFNIVIAMWFKDSAYYAFFVNASTTPKNADKVLAYMSVCLTALGVFGLAAAAVQPLVKRFMNTDSEKYLKIFICVCIPLIISTILNTFILTFYLVSWSEQNFLLLLTPRIIEEAIMVIYNSCAILLFIRLTPKDLMRSAEGGEATSNALA